MKIPRTRIFGLAAIASVTLLSLNSVKAQNADYSLNNDLVMFFQSSNALFSTNVVTLSLGNLTSIRNQAGTGNYTVLTSTLGTTLVSAYGSNWATSSEIYAGAFANRGTSSFVNNQFGSTGDSNRTVYFTQARGNNLGGGSSASNPNALLNNTELGSRVTSMGVIQNEFETASTSSPFVELAADSTVPSNAPIGGVQFANLTGVDNNFSGSFSFGGQNDVILALDLWRMKPSGTFSNSDGYGTALEPYFLGNVILKSTGEVGFLAVPEPTSAALLVLSGVALALCNRRRKTS
jgi:hypothetical protein